MALPGKLVVQMNDRNEHFHHSWNYFYICIEFSQSVSQLMHPYF